MPGVVGGGAENLLEGADAGDVVGGVAIEAKTVGGGIAVVGDELAAAAGIENGRRGRLGPGFEGKTLLDHVERSGAAVVTGSRGPRANIKERHGERIGKRAARGYVGSVTRRAEARQVEAVAEG